MNERLIETPRLIFRPFTENDLDLLFQLHSNPEVMKHHPWGVSDLEQTKEQLDGFISHQNEHGFSKWIGFLKDTGEFVGRAGLSYEALEVEVGFMLMPKFWGQGLGTELLEAWLDWAGSNISNEEIIAFVDKENLASVGLLKKFGFEIKRYETIQNFELEIYRRKQSKK